MPATLGTLKIYAIKYLKESYFLFMKIMYRKEIKQNGNISYMKDGEIHISGFIMKIYGKRVQNPFCYNKLFC